MGQAQKPQHSALVSARRGQYLLPDRRELLVIETLTGRVCWHKGLQASLNAVVDGGRQF